MKQNNHPSWIVAVSISAPMLFAIGAIGYFIAPTINDALINAMIVLTASAFGWLGGMFLSPDSKVEEKKFSDLWKGITLFASGYFVSKFDAVISEVVSIENLDHLSDAVVSYRVLASFTAFILTAILTYVVRVYAFDVAENRADTEL